MRAFEDYNPIAVFIYFACTAGIAMFCLNPVILVLSFLGAFSFYIVRNGRRYIKTHFMMSGMFVIMSLINPIFTHNGVTVLFVVGDSPITLEALLYGMAAALMIVSVIYWFRLFSQIMTSDRLLYIFGSISPKFALLISMALRYVPLFGRQAKKVNQVQKALGLYKEDNVIDNAKGGMRIFSVMTTWALENGIITADSMVARGYGIGKRTNFSNYKIRKSDVVMIVFSIFLFSIIVAVIINGALEFKFYPEMSDICMGPDAMAGYFAYGILAFLPVFIEMEEKIKWKYLESKI